MRIAPCAAAVVVVVACCGPPENLPLPPKLPAHVEGEVVIHSYAVRGRTVEQIGESLLDNGPVWEGRHAYALTRWHFSWGWRTLQEGDACRLADVRVKVAVEITLPQWVDWHRGSRRLQGRWERFERALLIHEHGHRDLGFRAASEIFRQLTAARASECLDVGVIARARARAVIQRYERLNDRYERDTRWGQTQGAVWPPEA